MECLPLRIPLPRCAYQIFDKTRQLLALLQIKIQLHRHRGRWCFQVKIINGILDRVLIVIRRAYQAISLCSSVSIQLVRNTVGISWPDPL